MGKEDQKPLPLEEQDLRNFSLKLVSRRKIKVIMLSILYYSIIFCLLKFVGFYLDGLINQSGLSSRSHQESSIGPLSNEGQLRILEKQDGEIFSLQKDSEDLEEKDLISRKISLSMGKISKSVQGGSTSIVLSKDNTLAFIMSIEPTIPIKIYNVSNFKAPVLIGRVRFDIAKFAPNLPLCLELSHNNKILFMSNCIELLTIDVSEPHSPQILGIHRSPEMWRRLSGLFASISPASMVVSKDLKRLFIGGCGLSIYDVSNLKDPAMVSSSLQTQDPEPSTVTSSSDGNYLFLTIGTVEVYKISDPEKMELLTSYKPDADVRSSMSLSKNKNILFISGLRKDFQIVMEKVDMTDPLSPTLMQSYEIGEYDFGKNFPARIIGMSPFDDVVFISKNSGYDYVLMLLDIEKGVFLDNQNGLIKKNIRSLVFAPDGSFMIAGLVEEFLFVELFLNFPNQRIFSLSTTPVEKFSTKNRYQHWTISPSQDLLYFTAKNYTGDKEGIFEIWNITNKAQPVKLSSLQIFNASMLDKYGPSTDQDLGEIYFVKISSDYTRAYLVYIGGSVVLNISDPRAPSLIREFPTQDPSTVTYKFGDCLFLSDGKRALFLDQSTDSTDKKFLKLLDYSDPTAVAEEISGISFINPQVGRMFLKDDQFLFFVHKNLTIYDISKKESPEKLATIPLVSEDDHEQFYVLSTTLSPDNKTIAVDLLSGLARRIEIYGVKSPSSLEHLGTVSLPKVSQNYGYSRSPDFVGNFDTTFYFTPNSKAIYLSLKGNVLLIDVSDRRNPVVSGIFPTTQTAGSELTRFVLAKDGQTGYVASSMKTSEMVARDGGKPVRTLTYLTNVSVIKVQGEYSLYLKKDKFLVGQRYSDDIMMLKYSSISGYDLLNKASFKLIKFSLFEIYLPSNKLTAEYGPSLLPYWISLDRDNNILTMEPKKLEDIGTFIFYSAVSLKIPMNEAFQSLGLEEQDSQDLITTLISLGYLDNQLFLTPSFGSLQGENDFLLPNKYSSSLKVKILQILRQYYIEVCTQFEIVSSLEVMKNSQKDKIFLSTTSPGSVKVDIRLDVPQARFIHKSYSSLVPSIMERNTRLAIDGTLEEINAALEKIVIDLEDGTASCDGYITVTDELNPPIINRKIESISKYFEVNQFPMQKEGSKERVQALINTVPVLTGQYFTIPINKTMFTDLHAPDSLAFDVISNEKGSPRLPSWLVFSDMALKGTPPEEIFGRDISLSLVVKNEFKEIRREFNLHIGISSIYVVKLLIRFSPYILTLLGLYIKFNKIYNVLGKKTYRYPKDFFVRVGEEISILPFVFIKEENEESEIILKSLRRIVAEKLGYESIDRQTLVKYFLDSEERIDKERVIKYIENSIAVEQEKVKKKLRMSLDGPKSRKNVVNQLIINQLIRWQLEMEEEKETRKIFEKLRGRWYDLVDLGEGEGLQLKLNQTKLRDALLSAEEERSGTKLLSGFKGNMGLLEDAILECAFANQSVDYQAIEVRIILREKVESDFLRRFLKFDLKEINSNDELRVDYGIHCKFKDNFLCFSGVPYEIFKNRTMIIQITNRKEKILKEIWVTESMRNGGEAAQGKVHHHHHLLENYEVL